MSRELSNILPALLEVQQEIKDPIKDAENPYFSSQYATLGSYLESAKEVLNKHGLLLLQPGDVGEYDDNTMIETVIMHAESGEFVSSRILLENKADDPQAQGSAITYARRYTLGSLLALDAVDDDAEAAMGRESIGKLNLSELRAELKQLVQEGIIPEDKEKDISTLSLTQAKQWYEKAINLKGQNGK